MKDFTHVSNFTGYMAKVADFICTNGQPQQTIFDIPAGNGLFADYLRENDFKVICGDINTERQDYIYINMEQKLPIEDGVFDFVVCMEGVEHVINPYQLISELCRITKDNGYIIITTPNIQSLYSRLKFLFTGIFYQFEPEFTRHPKNMTVDRGHITPFSYIQLNYILEEFNFEPILISGDKFKRKIFLPIYLFLYPLNIIYTTVKLQKTKSPSLRNLYILMRNKNLLLSRSLIAVWRKKSL